MNTETINLVTDIVLKSLIVLQEISNKSREEIIEMLKDEQATTKDLLAQLK